MASKNHRLSSRAVSAVILVMTLCAVVVSSAWAPPAIAADAPSEATFVELINKSRADDGLGNLAVYWDLEDDARSHSDTMMLSDTLYHNPDLRNVTTGWQSLGENVGYGYDVGLLHDAFMASPGHRSNILGNYNYVGIGTSIESDGTIWVTVVFMLGPDGLSSEVPDPIGPFPTSVDFVEQQYRDFFNREGDVSGVEQWSSAVNAGDVSPEEVIDQLMSSGEYEGRVAPVTRLYLATFLRVPDYDGLQFWIQNWQQGWSLERIADAFTESKEFQNKYGSVSDPEFVTLLYNNVLGRDPDLEGLDHWVARLESGQSRGSILVGFSESPEYRRTSQSEVNVLMATAGMLRRSPGGSSYASWVSRFDDGENRVALILDILSSPEYSDRF